MVCTRPQLSLGRYVTDPFVMSAEIPERGSHQNLRRWMLRIVVVTILGATTAGIVLVVSGIRTSLTAERHLHAMRNAIGACYAYVEEHEGEWPRSWFDVEPLFPDDRAWVRRVTIHIDFNADPAELAQQDWQSFTGIRVDRPIYPVYQGEMNALIELLQRYHPPDNS